MKIGKMFDITIFLWIIFKPHNSILGHGGHEYLGLLSIDQPCPSLFVTQVKVNLGKQAETY